MRFAALEDRIEADLERGRHAEVIGELERLVAEEPRERPRAQLMLALYRSGRQAEALDAYGTARRALVEELGIEPGRELKEPRRRSWNRIPHSISSARSRNSGNGRLRPRGLTAPPRRLNRS